MAHQTITNILGRINRESPLNILTAPTHERYESNLAKTGHNFYAVKGKGIKEWNSLYANQPENYKIVDAWDLEKIHIDIVLIQQKFGQYQALNPIANHLHVPKIVLEHTLPDPLWAKYRLEELKSLKGNLNLFISKYSIKEWGFKENDAYIVNHGIDTEIFRPIIEYSARENKCISVVNDWINRDRFCGYNIWKEATVGLPVSVYGDTFGLSRPTRSIEELVGLLNSHKIFINTSIISPVPTSLMEAMACGCAVISTNTCAIPEIIKDGYNGILCNNVIELRNAAISLLENPELGKKLGENARKTIVEKYSLSKFISRWNEIFEYCKHLKGGPRWN